MEDKFPKKVKAALGILQDLKTLKQFRALRNFSKADTTVRKAMYSDDGGDDDDDDDDDDGSGSVFPCMGCQGLLNPVENAGNKFTHQKSR